MENMFMEQVFSGVTQFKSLNNLYVLSYLYGIRKAFSLFIIGIHHPKRKHIQVIPERLNDFIG